jgi:hypothetical protein
MAFEQAPRVDRPPTANLLRHPRLLACHSEAALARSQEGEAEAYPNPAFK